MQEDFWVECNVCKQHLKNHVGSTPCCGSIAYKVSEDGSVKNEIVMMGSVNGGDIEMLNINLNKK